MDTRDMEQDLRAALARRAAEVPPGSGERVRGARYPVATRSRARLVGAGVAVTALIAGGGAYAGVSTGQSSAAHPSRAATGANGGNAAVKPLHARTVAYVGSSPTLAVTSLPPGFRLGTSTTLRPGPSTGKWFHGTSYSQKSFFNASGHQVINVQEIVGATRPPKPPIPKGAGLAAQHPQAVQHVSVGGHPALLLSMTRLDHRPGYVLSWSVGPYSTVTVSGFSLAQVEQVAAGVVPAGN